MTGSPPHPGFAWIGGASIVAGGLVAAVTGPLSLERGSWLAAYLVLVSGVAQLALGTGQARLSTAPSGRRIVLAELVSFNLGNAAVIAGTLAGMPIILDAGGLLLVIALACFIAAVRGSRSGPRWPLWVYRALIAILLVSIPVGLVIARLKA